MKIALYADLGSFYSTFKSYMSGILSICNRPRHNN